MYRPEKGVNSLSFSSNAPFRTLTTTMLDPPYCDSLCCDPMQRGPIHAHAGEARHATTCQHREGGAGGWRLGDL